LLVDQLIYMLGGAVAADFERMEQSSVIIRRLLEAFQSGGNSTSSSSPFAGCQSDAVSAFDQVSFIIGISLAIMAAISNNLGVNLQKLAWTKKQSGSSTVKRYRFIWLGGMSGIILASVFDFVALAFAPQSVIAPLGSLTMVMNACIAPYMHGEKLPKVVLLATVIIVSGCATAVASANHDNIICDFGGIFAFYLTAQSIVYFIFVTVLFCSVCLFIRRAERILQEFKQDSDEYQKIFKFHRVSYALVAGLLGGQSVVFARAIGLMFQASAQGDGIFLIHVQTYGILLGLIISIFIQMLYLNKGLSRFESTYNVPVFTGTFIVTVATAGGVVYGEFDGFTPLQAALFPIGVLMCIFGVFLLARGNPEPVDDESIEINNKVPSEGSIVTMQDIKDLENPEFAFKPTVPLPDPVVKPVPQGAPRNASLRIRSGGFIPFIIEENHYRRTSSVSSRPRARTDTAGNIIPGGSDNVPAVSASLRPNWLLGFRIDEEEDYVREGSTPSY